MDSDTAFYIAGVVIVIIIILSVVRENKKETEQSEKIINKIEDSQIAVEKTVELPAVEIVKKAELGYTPNYRVDVLRPADREPAYSMCLVTSECSKKLPLALLFYSLAHDIDSTNEVDIEFKVIEIPDCEAKGLPVVLMIRRDGQVLTYKGFSNYGSLKDFTYNAALLF